jgi:hypothetical protein
MAVIAVAFTALFVTIHDALTSAIWTNTLPSRTAGRCPSGHPHDATRHVPLLPRRAPIGFQDAVDKYGGRHNRRPWSLGCSPLLRQRAAQ